MATSSSAAVLQHLRRALLPPDGGALTDGQLLECFIDSGDEQAFAALVRRHGSMVWGVCRRHLTRPEDAEDAFQATFLVLARRAAAVRPRERVGNWLHGVAWQTTRKIRALTIRRMARERQLADLPEAAVAEQQQPTEDLRPLLDQEIRRLPAKYRIPLILCDLEQRTRKEVAQQLGWPEGTVAGRLARARALLARRLTRRGVVVSAVALDALLIQEAAAAEIPKALVAPTLEAARLLAAGQPLAAGLISPQARTLLEGTVKTMLMSEFKNLAFVVFLVGLVGLGVARVGYRAMAAAEGPQQTTQPAGASPTSELKAQSQPPRREARPRASTQDTEVKRRLEEKMTVKYEEQPLGDILKFLRQSTGLNIVVDAHALEQVGVTLNTPVTLELDEVPLRTVLKHVLHHAAKLAYSVEDGIVVVTTQGREQMPWRVYSVADLVGQDHEKNATKLVQIVMRTIAPTSWRDPELPEGQRGTIDYYPETQSLVVSQAPEIHEEIQVFLETLRKQRSEPKM